MAAHCGRVLPLYFTIQGASMKTISFLVLTVFCLTMLFFLNDTAFAQDPPQWPLPDGAIARLGKGSVGDIAYSPDGSRLAMASSLGIWIYDAYTGAELALFTGIDVVAIAFSPDGNTIASGNGDATVGLWDVVTGQQKSVLRGHRGYLTCIAFSPDGRTIASGSEDYDPLEAEMRLWDAATGREKAVFIYDDEQITSVTFSPDSRCIATGRNGPAAVIQDAITGEHKHTLNLRFGGYVWDIAFSPDGNTLAGSAGDRDGTVFLLDVANEQYRTISTGHTGAVFDIAFSPDGRTIASASWLDDTVRLWDAATGEERATLIGHTGGVGDVAYSPDGSMLATNSSGDSTVRLWDAATQDIRNTLTGYTPGVYNVAYSPDGSTLTTGSQDDTVRLWDATTNTLLNTLTGHTDWVRSIAYSPDGSTLASASWDDTVRLWDATTGAHLNTLTEHTDRVDSVAFSPDGSTLASGSWDNTVRLWDATTGAPLNTLTEHTDWVLSVAFSPDGSTLASGSSDNTVRLWDATTGVHLNTLTEHTDRVYSVAFSPDGSTLASGGGSNDTAVRLWDAATGRILNTFIGHVSYVRSVSYSPDGSTLASGSTDGTVLLWRLTPTSPPVPSALDVNGDGQVTVVDLAIVALFYGTRVPVGMSLPADVNADGAVDILDLTAVAQAIDAANNSDTLSTDDVAAVLEAIAGIEAIPEAPASHALRSGIASRNVAAAFADVKHLATDDARLRKWMPLFKELLQLLTEMREMPNTTTLLPNYPNPFNPETWIPYHLATDAEVTLTIYDVRGVAVRTLTLGHQPAGVYESRARAAYWDGKNQLGEQVASGVYFYTLTAGDFTATRKLLITK